MLEKEVLIDQFMDECLAAGFADVRSVLELFGLGKGHKLFEEAFVIRLARELEPIVETHPIMTAHWS